MKCTCGHPAHPDSVCPELDENRLYLCPCVVSVEENA